MNNRGQQKLVFHFFVTEAGGNTGGIDKRTPIAFEANEAAPWPDESNIPSTVLCVKCGKSCNVSVELINACKSDIGLQGRSVLGRLESVRSVTLLKLKLAQKEERCKSDVERTERHISVPEMSQPFVSHLKGRCLCQTKTSKN